MTHCAKSRPQPRWLTFVLRTAFVVGATGALVGGCEGSQAPRCHSCILNPQPDLPGGPDGGGGTISLDPTGGKGGSAGFTSGSGGTGTGGSLITSGGTSSSGGDAGIPAGGTQGGGSGGTHNGQAGDTGGGGVPAEGGGAGSPWEEGGAGGARDAVGTVEP